jgi:pimeloyl-ACP methyl ester carboxylesterase
MHVRLYGEVSHPALLLLHMGPLSGDMFRHFAPLLAGERHVVVPDRIGFGCSDHSPVPLTIADFADATTDVLDTLAIDTVDVFGVHTGAKEAIELAVKQPDRVRRVALVSLAVYSEEDVRAFRDQETPPPSPAADGSHLLWYWQRWMTWRASGLELDTLQQCVLDSLVAGPRSRWGREAVLAHPTGARLALIRQPLLVFAPNDYVFAYTRRGLALAPRSATVVPILLIPPGSTPVVLFTLLRTRIASQLRTFLR